MVPNVRSMACDFARAFGNGLDFPQRWAVKSYADVVFANRSFEGLLPVC